MFLKYLEKKVFYVLFENYFYEEVVYEVIILENMN